jgi:hypothetical protein
MRDGRAVTARIVLSPVSRNVSRSGQRGEGAHVGDVADWIAGAVAAAATP